MQTTQTEDTQTLTPQAVEFLSKRGLDVEALIKTGIHVVKKHGTDWLAIPYYQHGVVVNHKYRSLAEKRFEQDKDATKCFWNEDCLRDDTLNDMPVIITEGEFDAMAAMQAGFLRSISVPNGAPAQQVVGATSEMYNYIELSLFSKCKEIIIASDNDAPGANLLMDLSQRLGKARCKFLVYPIRPDGGRCKDLNEVLLHYGIKGINATVSQAKWMVTEGVYSMDELPPLPEPQQYRAGFGGLDDLYILRKGDLCIVTGIPGHGKSSFINDLAARMSMKHGWRTAFASFEQPPQTDHKRNLRLWHTGNVRGNDPEATKKWINDGFRFIFPSEDQDPTLEWVMEKCAMSVVQHSCDMLVIDPWNEIDHLRNKDESLTEYTGRAIKTFRRFAKQFNIHLIVAAHPAKLRKENGFYPAPNLYDISDSAHWYNKSDIGICVYRPSVDIPQTEVMVLKARYHGINGKPGVVKFEYDAGSRSYR